MDTKYERVAQVARAMTEGEAVVLVVVNGKEGSGYAVHAESGLNELLPSILRRVAKMIAPERLILFSKGIAGGEPRFATLWCHCFRCRKVARS